jgi:stage II sporulation protein D
MHTLFKTEKMFSSKPTDSYRMAQAVRIAVAVLGLALLATTFACLELPDRARMEEVLYPGDIKDVPMVRISILAAPELTVAVDGPFFLEQDNVRAQNPPLPAAKATASRGKLVIGATALSVRKVTIIPGPSVTVTVDNRKYPGTITLLAEKDSAGAERVRLIDNVNLEAYLCGVLAGEVPVDKWADEALKAQAVASRTYALYQVRTHLSDNWDMTGDDQSQVFRADATSNARVNRAVNQTRGLVLTWQQKIFSAYFTSSCGGCTEAAGNVWPGVASITPLAGTTCGYCVKPYVDQKHDHWTVAINHEVAAEALRAMFPEQAKLIKSVRQIEVSKRGDGGRAIELKFYGVPPLTAHAYTFRSHYIAALRSAPAAVQADGGLQSLFIGEPEPVRGGNVTKFKGSGWGHGVGLCQWGSQGMAKSGKGYAAILQHYYPGSVMVRLPYHKDVD